MTMFVLKAFWDNEPAYYMNINDTIPSGMTFVHLTTHIDSATKFNSVEEAEEACSSLDTDAFKIYPICPICGKDYDGHPAISRKDNKTKICSHCGIGEAFLDFIENQKDSKDPDFGKAVLDFIEKQKKATNL